jgi:hypothetical protein
VAGKVQDQQLAAPGLFTRNHQAEMGNSQLLTLTESLRKQGVADKIISAAIAEAKSKTA